MDVVPVPGEPAAAREHCDEGRRLYDPERHRSHRLLYGGHDPGVCAGYLGAQAYWLLGYPEQALAIGSEGLMLAERIAHPMSLALSLTVTAMLHLNRGELEMALHQLDTAEALIADQRLPFVHEPKLLRGAALSAQGVFAEALVYLREGLAGMRGQTHLGLWGLAQLAEALARQSEHSASLLAVRGGLEAQERTAYRQWEAELRHLEGVALVGLNRLQEGQIALEEALRIARWQQARSYELRAATSLARLWGEQGRRGEARELLAPVYGWFTEGFDTQDLKEAKGLLDELT